MGFTEIETKGKQLLEQYPAIKHTAKRVYQVASVTSNKDKVKVEGNIIRVSPDDDYEYFYGYYDKSPWDADDRYMICVRVKQAYKSVAPREPGTVCLIDTKDNNKLIEIGVTHSWNVQQSCMAQWMGPDFKKYIIYNDFRDGSYCSVLFDVEQMKEEKVLSLPVYDVARDGSFALSLDFNRLHRMRPGYGYSNLPDRTKGILCPDDYCIWKIDIKTGKVENLFKYTDFASFEPDETMEGAEHKVNHLMISPNGKRFMVLHRWFLKGRKHTRLVTVNIDKTEMYNLSDDVFVSHCYWKNDSEILSFLRKKETGDHYYLMRDKTRNYRMYWPELNTDGHCSYSPNGKFIITDTYPNRKRIASVFLCTEEDNRSRRIARVFSPFKYDNDCRCDLHPRWNREGNKICIDSVHEGKRGLYVLDVAEIIDNISFNKDRFVPRKEKLISFVIPAYNAETTIGRCLESIIRQTSNNWEAIVVDDGSEDNTLKVLDQYKDEQRIIVATQKNAGPGKARNRGIELTTGDYIAFVDADDYIEANYVELVEEMISYTNADVVMFEMVYEKKDVGIYKRTSVYKYASEDRKSFITRQMSGTFPWSGCIKVIKKELLEEARANYGSEDVGEEALYSLKVLTKAQRIEFVKVPLYHYVYAEEGQHTKGSVDPLNGAVHSVKEYLIKTGQLSEYDAAITNMAYKAVSMSLYRTALRDSCFKAIREMKKKLHQYDQEFDFKKTDVGKLNRSAKMLLPFIRHRLVFPIYIASQIRKITGDRD